MNNKLQKSFMISARTCDNTGTISYGGIFDLFMDLATEHGAEIKLGMKDLAEKGCFWVVAKTRIVITRKPSMLEQVTLSTWPEKPGNIRCNRYYAISDDNGYIVEGKSEWTILDKETLRPKRSSEVYPEGLEHLTDKLCDEPFRRLPTDFADAEEIRTYTVCSNDIDLSQHMNNVAYIRGVLGAFSCSEIEAMNIREIEISYRLQCYEGEHLSIRRITDDEGIIIGIIKEDGSTAATLRIITG